MKKERSIYLTDREFEQLKEKAREHYEGKGFVSKFLVKLAKARGIIIIEGSGNFKITAE